MPSSVLEDGSPRSKNEPGWLQRKIESICTCQLMSPRYRSDSLVALRVAAGKSTPSDDDSRRSAPDLFGSPRWNASPIVGLCRLLHRSFWSEERCRETFGAGDYRAGWYLLDDDAVELDHPMGWEPLTHACAPFENEEAGLSLNAHGGQESNWRA
jgi:hypothetical protein